MAQATQQRIAAQRIAAIDARIFRNNKFKISVFWKTYHEFEFVVSLDNDYVVSLSRCLFVSLDNDQVDTILDTILDTN